MFFSRVAWSFSFAIGIQGNVFCWRDSVVNGAGRVPNTCAEGYDRIGLLCYEKCPTGYKRFDFDCHQTCLEGWRDDGLFCRYAEYGRGAGYPWKFGDGFRDRGMYSRCEAANGAGKCEKWGAVVYPKCKSGFHPVGCCICRPDKPDCKALGFQGQFDISCSKKIIIGRPKTGVCAADEEKSVGLCYKKCPQGYYRASVVCWAKSPENWITCGMGAAKNARSCTDKIMDQVMGPLFTIPGFKAMSLAMKALKYAGKGLENAVTPAAKSLKKFASPYYDKFLAKKNENPYYRMDVDGKDLDPNDAPGGLSGAQKQLGDEPGFGPLDAPISPEAVSFRTKAKEFLKAHGGKIKKVATLLGNGANVLSDGSSYTTVADMVRLEGLVLSILDPTGIANVVGAYSYPKCSKLHFNETNFILDAANEATASEEVLWGS